MLPESLKPWAQGAEGGGREVEESRRESSAGGTDGIHLSRGGVPGADSEDQMVERKEGSRRESSQGYPSERWL